MARVEGLISLVEYVKYEISCRMSAQEDIFARFENAALEKCGFLPLLRSCRVEDEKSALFSALEKHGNLTSFSEILRVISDFAETLGTLPRAAQEESCDVCARRLGELYAAEKQKAVGQIKLCRSMGVLVGFTAVLLFL